MDSAAAHATSSFENEDDWDTEGFIIPSLDIDNSNSAKTTPELDSESSSPKARKEENIYLGPHGAPPSQSKQQEQSTAGHKQRFKQKLKEADRRVSGTGRENKLENLQELLGSGKVMLNMPKGSPRDWLDPHCNESQFERRHPQ
ncbi:hypothetical protein NMG60_11037378 [Bertholletia excelsa]